MLSYADGRWLIHVVFERFQSVKAVAKVHSFCRNSKNIVVFLMT